MKRLLIALLICSSAFGQELRRPTADSSTGTPGSLGCSFASVSASSSLPFAYDLAGLSTSDFLSVAAAYKSQKGKVRTFNTWQSAGGTYTTLTLNINSSSPGYVVSAGGTSGTGSACLSYSLDSGGTWSRIKCDTSGAGWAQQTFSIALLPAQDLSKVQVAGCVTGSATGMAGDVGGDAIEIFDIWTLGASSSAASGNGSSSGLAHRGVVVVN